MTFIVCATTRCEFSAIYLNLPSDAPARSQHVLEATGTMGFHVLATTRKEHAIPSSPGWRLLPVPPLGEDDALLVLKNYSGSPVHLPRESALQVSRHRLTYPSRVSYRSDLRTAEPIKTRSCELRQTFAPPTSKSGCKGLRFSTVSSGHSGFHAPGGGRALVCRCMAKASRQAGGQGRDAAQHEWPAKFAQHRPGRQLQRAGPMAAGSLPQASCDCQWCPGFEGNAALSMGRGG